MGIKGLEWFINENNLEFLKNNVIIYKELKDLKLVVDGNQLPFRILEKLKSSHYSGNYDQMYETTKSLLTKLKPFIEVVIFDGTNKDSTKSKKKLTERICKYMNFEGCNFSPAPSQSQHLNELKTSRSLFFRNILDQVLNELEIKQISDERKNIYLIASYANGLLDDHKSVSKLTVLSKDSYFNVYDLENGYISWKDAASLLENFNEITENTKLPVFYLKNMLSYFQIQHITWIYFCILNGDYDLNIGKQVEYYRKHRIPKRSPSYQTDHMPLLNHLKANENSLLDQNFKSIRSMYDNQDLEKIDNLIAKLELKANTSSLKYTIDSQDTFDKQINDIKFLKENYLNCCIEDPVEKTCFHIAQKNEIFNMVYYELNKKFGTLDEIKEYYRNGDATSLAYCLQNSQIKAEKPKNTTVYDYLLAKNKLLIDDNNNLLDPNEKDDFTLFFTALSVWYEWLGCNSYNNKIEYSPDLFLDALLANCLIINFKKKLETKEDVAKMPKWIQVDEDEVIKQLEIFNALSDAYNSIVRDNKVDAKDFFDNDIKIIHRINEFQAVYFAINILNKACDFKFTYLCPSKFLNGKFICEYIKNSDMQKIMSLNFVSAVKKNLLEKFKKCHSDIFNDVLVTKLESIKLN